MKLGLFGLNFGEMAGSLVELASFAESLGYDSLWLGEHVVLPDPRVPPSPLDPRTIVYEPITAFAAIAAVTSRIELGTGIVILPQRNPVVLAKQVATLDALSGGRFTIGVGAGYLEPEMSAIGVPMAGRGRRTDEYLAAMRELWSSDSARFAGDFVSFSGVTAHPQPPQGRPRVVVGGHTPPAFRRAAASAHGWYGWFLDPGQAAGHIAQLHEAVAAADRDSSLGALEIIVTPRGRFGEDERRAFEAAGVDHVVLFLDGRYDEADARNFIETHAPERTIRP